MKLEQQVCSLELAKKLKALGVKQDCYLVWRVPPKVYSDMDFTSLNFAGDRPYYYERENYKSYSAFTVAELGEMLKQSGLYSGYSEEDVGWYCQSSIHSKFDIIEQDTEADARAKMLIQLIENQLVNPGKLS